MDRNEQLERAPRVLLADDDPQVRAVIGRLLRRRGYRVQEATTGPEACRMAVEEVPDLVLLDLLMPRLDGYAVLLNLRTHEATRHVPVIVLSGEDASVHARTAETLGADAFFEKPVDLDELEAEAARLLVVERDVVS